MKKSNNTINAFGIEIVKLPKKERAKYEALIVRSREDILPEYLEGLNVLFELKDGSILEIIAPDFPRESRLKLYKNEQDYLKMLAIVDSGIREFEKYKGKTDYEVISFKVAELEDIGKNHNQILADSLKLEAEVLDYSKESLKYFNKPFMRVIDRENIDNKPLIKSLLYYLAETLHRNLPESEIKFDVDSGLVRNIQVIDKENHVFNADLGIFEIWAEGAMTEIETGNGRRKRARLTLDVLFSIEVKKYKHRFDSKPSRFIKME